MVGGSLNLFSEVAKTSDHEEENEPYNHLCDALRVVEALGFRYVTNIVWTKDRVGLGQYFRGQHELLLLGSHGRYLEMFARARRGCVQWTEWGNEI